MSPKSIADRIAAFKPTVDAEDGRRRRSETTVMIRKNKKDDRLKKRREGGLVTGEGNMSSSSKTSAFNSVFPIAQDISRLALDLANHATLGPDRLLEITREARRILSAERNQPVDEAITHGVVLSLVNIIKSYSQDINVLFEAIWALTNLSSASTSGAYAVAQAGVIPFLTRLLSHDNPNIRWQSAWVLGNLAGEDIALRDQVLQDHTVIHGMLENLCRPHTMELLETVVWALSNFCRGRPAPPVELTNQLVQPIVQLVFNNISMEAMIDCMWALSYLSDGDDAKIEAVMSTGILTKLMEVVTTKELRPCLFCGLRILGNFVSGNTQQTQRVVDAGILHNAYSLLNSSKKSLRKETAWLVSNIVAGTLEQITAVITTPRLLKRLIDCANNDVWDVRKECIWALANICSGGEPNHIKTLVQAEGLEPLCSILNMSTANPDMLCTALEALENIMKVSNNQGMNYAILIDEHNGIEYLEELQKHPNEGVYSKAIEMIESYFGVEGDEENVDLAPKANGDTFGFGLTSPKQLFPSASTVPCTQQQQHPTQTFDIIIGQPTTNEMIE